MLCVPKGPGIYQGVIYQKFSIRNLTGVLRLPSSNLSGPCRYPRSDSTTNFLSPYTLLLFLPSLVKKVLPSRWRTQFTAIPLPHHGSYSPCPWRGAFHVPSISKFTGVSSILSAHTCRWAQERCGAQQSGDATYLFAVGGSQEKSQRG